MINYALGTSGHDLVVHPFGGHVNVRRVGCFKTLLHLYLLD